MERVLSAKDSGKKVHIILDDSASMQGSIKIDELADEFNELANSLSSLNVITFSKLSSDEIFSKKDQSEFVNALKVMITLEKAKDW